MEDIFFDSHTHLVDKGFADDRDEAIKRARAVGVARTLVVGGDMETNRLAVEMAHKMPDCLCAAVGFHPNSLPEMPDNWREELEKAASQPGVVALGETGLDLFRKRSSFARQQDAFAFHMSLSRSTGLPLVIHQRSAEREMLAMLRSETDAHGPVKGVMHCFAGDEKYAEALVELGMYVSFAGTITYPRNRSQRHALSVIPEDKLLLETDAPYLPPDGHRGERCEPSMLELVAVRVAEQLRLDTLDVARITRRNAIRLFRVDAPDPGAVVYPIRKSLYVNMTNRCSSSCVFCPLSRNEYIVKGHNLKLDTEPSADEIISLVERELDRGEYKEVVFCGLGEPTIRLKELVHVGRKLRARGVRVRLDSNGQGSLIHGHDIVPELKEAVDEVSVSLNAADAARYAALCRPPGGEKAFAGVLDFIKRSVAAGIRTSVTAVAVPDVDVEHVRAIADSLGAAFRPRKYNRLG